MIFILFNITLFFTSIFLMFEAFVNYSLFLDLPLIFEILILIGLVTPVMCLYDTIRNFVTLYIMIGESNEKK